MPSMRFSRLMFGWKFHSLWKLLYIQVLIVFFLTNTSKLTRIVKHHLEIVFVRMCFILTILWKHSYTIFRVFSSSEAFVRVRRVFAQCIFKKGGFVQSIMLLHATFTGLIYSEEKKINFLTRSDGICYKVSMP